MESWRKVWRDGIAPLLSEEALQALAWALAEDDPRLVQGHTCREDVDGWVRGACALGYAGWEGEGLHSREEVEQFFGDLCAEINDRLDSPNDPPMCSLFLNWFDETPREEMRRELLPEVRRELQRRQGVAA